MYNFTIEMALIQWEVHTLISVISEILPAYGFILIKVLFFLTFGRNEDSITYLNFTLEDHTPKKVDVIYEVKDRGKNNYYIYYYICHIHYAMSVNTCLKWTSST